MSKSTSTRIQFPEVGLGSTVFWYKNRDAEKAMARAVNEGLISLIDTAEMYGSGRSEEAVGRVLKETGREKVFLVDKILPDNATPSQFRKSLENSLQRLGTDHIDLYLLHWREKADLAFVAYAMTEAVEEGLVIKWGVSNFDVSDMEDLFAEEHGSDCCTDQVLYNLCERGPEYDLFPWLSDHGVRPMSYSSLGSDVTRTRKNCESDSVIQAVSAETGLSPAAIMLAFNTRNHDLCALFGSSSFEHIKADLAGIGTDLDPFLEKINEAFPAPTKKVPLAKI
ncbi:MAG: aldo/keto reductase [Candidatus Weimeria sp.]